MILWSFLLWIVVVASVRTNCVCPKNECQLVNATESGALCVSSSVFDTTDVCPKGYTNECSRTKLYRMEYVRNDQDQVEVVKFRIHAEDIVKVLNSLGNARDFLNEGSGYFAQLEMTIPGMRSPYEMVKQTRFKKTAQIYPFDSPGQLQYTQPDCRIRRGNETICLENSIAILITPEMIRWMQKESKRRVFVVDMNVPKMEYVPWTSTSTLLTLHTGHRDRDESMIHAIAKMETWTDFYTQQAAVAYIDEAKSTLTIDYVTSFFPDMCNEKIFMCIDLNSTTACSGALNAVRTTEDSSHDITMLALEASNLIQGETLVEKSPNGKFCASSTFKCSKNRYKGRVVISYVVNNVHLTTTSRSSLVDDVRSSVVGVGLEFSKAHSAFVCSQVTLKDKTKDNRSYSIYSIVSALIFSTAFVGAFLVVRMNGMSFSPTSIWTDITSICVLIVMFGSAMNHIIWIVYTSKAQSSIVTLFSVIKDTTQCVGWTALTSVCFHWISVVRYALHVPATALEIRIFVLINVAYYLCIGCELFLQHGMVSCMYRDYLQNPQYANNPCGKDACSDLQPFQWYNAASGVCLKNTPSLASSVLYVVTLMAYLLVGIVLVILGTIVIARAYRLVQKPERFRDQSIFVKVQRTIRKYLFFLVLLTMLVTTISIAHLVLFLKNIIVEATLYYICFVWLPLGLFICLLLLQWNPALHGNTKVNYDMDIGSGGVSLFSRPSDIFRLTQTPSGQPDAFVLEMPCTEKRSSVAHKDFSYLDMDFPATPHCTKASSIGISIEVHFPVALEVDEQYKIFVVLSNESSFPQLSESTGLRQHECRQVSANIVSVPLMMIPMQGNIEDGRVKFVVQKFMQRRTCRDMESLENGDSNMTLTQSDTSHLDYGNSDFTFILPLVAVKGTDLDGIFVASTEEGQSSQLFTNHIIDETYLHIRRVKGLESYLSDDSCSSMKKSACRQTYTMNGSSLNARKDVVEELVMSIWTHVVPPMFLSQLAVLRHENVKAANEQLIAFSELSETCFSTSAAAGMYENILDQIQLENKRDNIIKWLQDRKTKQNEYIDQLETLSNAHLAEVSQRRTLKTCKDARSSKLRFAPLNLVARNMTVEPRIQTNWATRNNASQSNQTYSTVTCGTLSTSHDSSSTSYVGLETKSIAPEKSLWSLQSQLLDSKQSFPLNLVDHNDTILIAEELFTIDEVYWQYQTRMDWCFSQCLTTLIARFCSSLEMEMQHDDPGYCQNLLHQWCTLGYLYQVEALLRVRKGSMHNYEDMIVAINALDAVQFVVSVADAASGYASPPKDSSNTANSGGFSIVDVQVSFRKEASTLVHPYPVTVNVWVNECAIKTPEQPISVVSVLFSQDLHRHFSHIGPSRKRIRHFHRAQNEASLQKLRKFCTEYTRLGQRLDDKRYFVSSMRMCFHLSKFDSLMLGMKSSFFPSRCPEFFQEIGHFCRLLRAGQVIYCSKGIDCSAVATTLRQVQILSRYHQLPFNAEQQWLDDFRRLGTSLDVAHKNRGVRCYDFEGQALSALPVLYQCPEDCYSLL